MADSSYCFKIPSVSSSFNSNIIYPIDDTHTSTGNKKTKTQFVFRTTEEVVEEASKGGIHKMAREYR